MKSFRWLIVLGLLLVALSAVFYAIHFLFFRDAQQIFFWFLLNLAFLPIEVLLVTIILSGLLSRRERRARLKKMNMVIGAFFTEVGTELLKRLRAFDLHGDKLAGELILGKDWPDREFDALSRKLSTHDARIVCKKEEMLGLKSFLLGKLDFLLRLLENPNLLEHDSFTDLLWAVFHLADELAHRKDLSKLPDSDLEHLAGDIRRAYLMLITEWVAYMKHLKSAYPYLFSLAMRTNPFDPSASVEVR